MLVGFMPLTVSANPSISLDKAIYAPGEKITVATSGITQELIKAYVWVGIYNIGDPYAEEPISYKSISAVGTGRIEFTNMLRDGGYEIRLITGVGTANRDRVTAEHIVTSVGFTVDKSSVTIALNKTVYAPGEKITVATSGITSGMVSSGAWVGIYNPGDPHSAKPVWYERPKTGTNIMEQ